MKSENLPITGPCPIDLDATDFDRSATRAHCAHCEKDVHNLSQMTEAQARDFLRTVAGKKVCVSYARDGGGKIRFAPQTNVVPLTRVRARSRAAAAVGIGLAASLAACTPHENDRVQKPAIEVKTKPAGVVTAGEAVVPTEPPAHRLPPPPIDPNEMVDGQTVVPDVEMVEGEIEAPPIEPAEFVRGEIAAVQPCDPKTKG